MGSSDLCSAIARDVRCCCTFGHLHCLSSDDSFQGHFTLSTSVLAQQFSHEPLYISHVHCLCLSGLLPNDLFAVLAACAAGRCSVFIGIDAYFSMRSVIFKERYVKH